MKRLSHSFGKEHTRVEFPKIRLGLQPFRYKDQHKKFYIGFEDPLKLSDEFILIPHDLYFLLQFFDGEHSTSDITSEYMRQFNNFLPATRLTKMIKKLDDGFLLDNKRSRKRIQQIEHAYRKQEFRAPVCAGSSYAADKDELVKELARYKKESLIDAATVDQFKDQHIRAMVLPHIDPRLGGAVYGAAYNALQISRPIDLFIVLGISHQPTHYPFAVTIKDFQTPLGLVKTNQHFVTGLLEKCSTDFLQDEIIHRDEHSIEFQTVFLKHNQKSDFQIVPILCSFSHVLSDVQKKQFKEFSSALQTQLDDFAGSVCIIASVDFSHIGPHYGDDFNPDSYILTKVENADRAVLNSLENCDIKEFENCFTRTNNKYKICGYPALRTLLEILPPAKATLLKYDNAIMDEQRSTVTFASMLFS